MREVFLDDIPKDGRGFFDWKNSIGKKIKFIYDEVEGELPILNYVIENKRNYIITEYENTKNFRLWIGDISKCKLGSLLGKYKIDYMYSIGDIVENGKNGKLEIINRTRIQTKGIVKNGKQLMRNLKSYIYICLNCGDKREKTEDELKKNGCSVCANREILKGYNDLWTRRPDIAKLLKFPERGYQIGLGSGSNEEIFICPECGYEKSQILHNACKQGFSCDMCGDGISYPEKFVTNVLKQSGVSFEKEKKFKWSNNKRYDFYIPSLNCIIETHGEQHYRYTGRGRLLEEEQENDRIKEKLAKDNDIENYIIIDCRKSELEYIKNKILHSRLVGFYELHKINWEICDKNATQSNIKVACEMWESGKTIEEISMSLIVHGGTVRCYLKQGNKLGWCTYDPIKESEKGLVKMAKMNKKEVVQLSLNGNFIKRWESIKEASRNIKIHDSTIHSVLRGRTKTAAGYKWMYKEDYDRYIENENLKEINLI